MRPLIIERPDLQTAAQRYGYVSLTVICWFVWLYLFVPLLSLAAWAIGGAFIYEKLLLELTEGNGLERLAGYGYGIAILGAVYLAWAIYNYLRWRGVERRLSSTPVTADEIAERFGLSRGRVDALRRSSIDMVSFQEQAALFEPDDDDLIDHLGEIDEEPSEGPTPRDEAA
jgi:biofilm PGA synthesis protein PgaD